MAEKKKTALITGCSDDGIGSMLAIILRERVYHVFATARNVDKMKKLAGFDAGMTLLKLDVVNPRDIQAVVEAVTEHTGGTLDCFISNAGRNHFMPILDDDLAKAREIFEINLFGPIALTQAVAPLLIKAKGKAVYIVSTSGHLNIPFMGTYAASKIGLEVVAETLRLELKPFGVDVLEVVTGGVKSMGQTYFKDLKVPEGSLYKTIESDIINRANGGDGMPRTDTREYCESVVADIMGETTGRVWYGAFADKVRRQYNFSGATSYDGSERGLRHRPGQTGPIG